MHQSIPVYAASQPSPAVRFPPPMRKNEGSYDDHHGPIHKKLGFRLFDKICIYIGKKIYSKERNRLREEKTALLYRCRRGKHMNPLVSTACLHNTCLSSHPSNAMSKPGEGYFVSVAFFLLFVSYIHYPSTIVHPFRLVIKQANPTTQYTYPKDYIHPFTAP